MQQEMRLYEKRKNMLTTISSFSRSIHAARRIRPGGLCGQDPEGNTV